MATKRNQLNVMLGAAAMIAGMSESYFDEVKAYRSEASKNEFRKFHDEMRAKCKRGFVVYRGKGTYKKPTVPGIVSGKSARKAAKKQRMKALRATQVSNEQGEAIS